MKDKEVVGEAVHWKGDLYSTSMGDGILGTWHKLRDIAENVAGLSCKATHSALCQPSLIQQLCVDKDC